MIQRLQIALTQIKASNKSKNLLNEMICLLYSSKEITKKV